MINEGSGVVAAEKEKSDKRMNSVLFGQRFTKLHCLVFPLWTENFRDIRQRKRPVLCT